MKRFCVGGMVALLFMAYGFEGCADEAKVSGSASLGVFNRYIFRGYRIGGDSVVFQPGLGIAYRGFSAAFWGNIDSHEHATRNFAPDRPGKKSFNETDLALSYTYNVDKLALTGGYIYYGTKYTAESEEVYASVGYDTFAKPTLTIYRDVNSYPGTYINLSLAQSWKVYGEVTVDLGASGSYFVGDGGYWKTYQSSTGAYTGEKYQAFQDGLVKAGLTIPMFSTVAVQPMVQYWFPLSNKAQRTINGNSYNPNGYMSNSLVTGVSLSFGF